MGEALRPKENGGREGSREGERSRATEHKLSRTSRPREPPRAS